MRAGHLSIRDQGRQDQIMPAQDEDLPFVLSVEGAFRITGRGTVVMGVIEQGTLRIGDHLEMIQPGSAATVAPLRVQCQARENCKSGPSSWRSSVKPGKMARCGPCRLTVYRPVRLPVEPGLTLA